MPDNKEKNGLVLVYTGNGKGKTTAALGQMIRALGWNMKVVMFQFIKNTDLDTGEHRIARKLGLDIRSLGEGFIWESKDQTKAKALASEQWDQCRKAIISGQFNMIILDEVSYPLNHDWILLTEVLDTIKHRPKGLHLILTGRDMPQKINSMADLVTEMTEIKHPYQQGTKAQKGIEY